MVRESWRFDDVPGGEYHVYAMDKQKLTTFAAVDRICQIARLPRSSISFCGLKDKQGRTEQLIAVKARDIDVQEPDLRLRKVGRTDRPLSARNTSSNRFAVTVRDLSQADVDRLPEAVAEVQRLGVVNYFDSQRFGHLKHGQGFVAKDILKGSWEHALNNLIAKPSPLDRTGDAKVKLFWQEHWGEWSARCPYPEMGRYRHMLHRLQERPRDFKGAFMTLEPRERAMVLFTYQSYLWNEGVKLLLRGLVGERDVCHVPYQAGTLLFPRAASAEARELLREGTFPLLAPDSALPPGRVSEAALAVLSREGLTLERLRIPDSPLFFKHEERPIAFVPGKLVVSKPARDEHFEGKLRVHLAFTLPPGSYATLVTRRLFWFALAQGGQDEREDRPGHRRPLSAKPAVRASAKDEPAPRTGEAEEERPKGRGFLARKRARHAARAASKQAKAKK
ncbi:MAG: tRNA pseudouridine(13) synthase TruD [Deltaproteobacteria bacterium]